MVVRFRISYLKYSLFQVDASVLRRRNEYRCRNETSEIETFEIGRLRYRRRGTGSGKPTVFGPIPRGRSNME